MKCLIILTFRFSGLQDRVVDLKAGSDRSSERYIFDDSSMFDCRGKTLIDNDCVFFPALSTRSSTPILKGFRCVYKIICKINSCVRND